MCDIRLQRVQRRISQWELAKRTGISQSRISLFENGYIELKDEEVDRIMDALTVERGTFPSLNGGRRC